MVPSLLGVVLLGAFQAPSASLPQAKQDSPVALSDALARAVCGTEGPAESLGATLKNDRLTLICRDGAGRERRRELELEGVQDSFDAALRLGVKLAYVWDRVEEAVTQSELYQTPRRLEEAWARARGTGVVFLAELWGPPAYVLGGTRWIHPLLRHLPVEVRMVIRPHEARCQPA